MSPIAAPDWIRDILDLFLYLLLAGAMIGIVLVVVLMVKGKLSSEHMDHSGNDQKGFVYRLGRAIERRDVFQILVLIRDGFFSVWILYAMILLLLIFYAVLSYQHPS